MFNGGRFTGATQNSTPFRTPVPVGSGTFHGVNNSHSFVPMRKPFGSNVTNLQINFSKNGPGGNSPP